MASSIRNHWLSPYGHYPLTLTLMKNAAMAGHETHLDAVLTHQDFYVGERLHKHAPRSAEDLALPFATPSWMLLSHWKHGTVTVVYLIKGGSYAQALASIVVDRFLNDTPIWLRLVDGWTRSQPPPGAEFLYEHYGLPPGLKLFFMKRNLLDEYKLALNDEMVQRGMPAL